MRTSSILAAITGNIIEWYDFTLYIFLAPVIAHNFFPAQNQVNAMLSTFMIFAVGFFIRPLGAVVFGHLGDKLGRTVTLKISILLISLPTIAIACLPNYQHWGIYAGLCLVICRLLQGLSIGGEFAGSMIYLSEMAAANKRALASCMTNNGSNFGILCATLTAAFFTSVMSESSFYDYGWRFPFLLGGVLGLIGLWLRNDIAESPVFTSLQAKAKLHSVPLLTIFRHYKKEVLHIFMLLIFAACGSYVLMDFMSTYLHQYYHYTLAAALKIATVYDVMTFGLVITAAKLSDHFGRRPMLLISAVGYVICSIPCFYLLQHDGSWLWLLPLVIFYCIEEATVPVTMAEMFPAAARYTGISVGYNFAMALIGGTSPLINTWLVARFNSPLVIGCYLAIGAAISLYVVLQQVPREFGYACDLAA